MSSGLPGTFPQRGPLPAGDTSSSQAGGTANNSSSPLAAYALPMATLNDTINSLRATGIELYLEDELPMIVTMGDQGTGKSSLTESIAGILLPKGIGTTTRCPMEIILKSSPAAEGTKYRVSLRDQPQKNSSSKTENKPVPFAMTDSTQELLLIIKRAQLALLNPKKEPKDFLNLDESEFDNYRSECVFSRDLVVIEVYGAETDVTFIDLPGIIVNANTKEEENLKHHVNELSRYYASLKESLVLVTVSMEGDLNTTAALSVATECDPTGSRTKVVLTKVDRVQPEAYKYWLNVLLNDNMERYFVTMLKLKEGDTKGEWAVLCNKPWNEVKPAQKGIKNVRVAISKLLADRSQQKLPIIFDHLKNQKVLNEKALASLPPAFSENPQQRLLELIGDFLKHVSESTTVRGQTDNLVNDSLCDEYEKLAARILSTRPQFGGPDSGENSSKADLSGARPRVRSSSSNSSTSTFVSSDEGETASSGISVRPQIYEAMSLDVIRDIIKKRLRKQEVIPLGIVRQIIKKKLRRQLPGEIDSTDLVPEFTTDLITTWQKFSFEAFRAVEKHLENLMDKLCKEYFGNFTGSGLLSAVKDVAKDIMQEAAEETRKAMGLSFELEENRPFTQNRDAFITSKEEHMINFHYALTQPNWQFPEKSVRASFTIHDSKGGRRSVSRDYLSENELMNQATSYLLEKGIQVSNPKKLALLSSQGEYGTELAFMSACLAYFDISSMRVIEDMPRIFEVVYLKRFERKLWTKLASALNLNNAEGVETCKRFTKENGELQEKRRRLTGKQEALCRASEILRPLLK